MPSVFKSEEKETIQHIIWMLDLSCEAVQHYLLQRISPVLVDYEHLDVEPFHVPLSELHINSVLQLQFVVNLQQNSKRSSTYMVYNWWWLVSNKKENLAHTMVAVRSAL